MVVYEFDEEEFLKKEDKKIEVILQKKKYHYWSAKYRHQKCDSYSKFRKLVNKIIVKSVGSSISKLKLKLYELIDLKEFRGIYDAKEFIDRELKSIGTEVEYDKYLYSLEKTLIIVQKIHGKWCKIDKDYEHEYRVCNLDKKYKFISFPNSGKDIYDYVSAYQRLNTFDDFIYYTNKEGFIKRVNYKEYINRFKFYDHSEHYVEVVGKRFYKNIYAPFTLNVKLHDYKDPYDEFYKALSKRKEKEAMESATKRIKYNVEEVKEKVKWNDTRKKKPEIILES